MDFKRRENVSGLMLSAINYLIIVDDIRRDCLF